MKNRAHLCDFLDQRREALIAEHELVDRALVRAERGQELNEWLEKLEAWRDELRTVVMAMPNISP
jgi:hypothetical protein